MNMSVSTPTSNRKINKHGRDLEFRLTDQSYSNFSHSSDETKASDQDAKFRRIREEALAPQIDKQNLDKERQGFTYSDIESIAIDRASCRDHIDYLQDCLSKTFIDRDLMLKKISQTDAEQKTMLLNQ